VLPRIADSDRRLRIALDGKAERCGSFLREARRLIALRSYGSPLRQLIARAYDLFDEIDEILLGLDLANDHDAFARVAALHRNFDEIQSLIPRIHRS
jgi:hypothetical protein